MKRNRFTGIIQISRPVNVLISMLSIFVAVLITGILQPVSHVLLACLSGGIIMAGSNTLNDYFDLDIDRVNRPRRPLVSGKLDPPAALGAALAEFTLGILMAAFITMTALWIAMVVSALIIFYCYRLKRRPLIGNLAVSFSTAMAFVYGGAAVNRIEKTLIPAVLAFFFHFGREIIKDVQDMAGDSHGKARTIPLVLGDRAALKITTWNFILLMILLPLPFIFRWYGLRYLITVLLGIYPVLLFSLLSIWRNPSPGNLGFISNLLKADMPVGLLAVYLG